MIVLAWLLAVGLSVQYFQPKPPATKDGKQAKDAKQESKYKFLHCDQCKMEIPYSEKLDGSKCPKCVPPKPGFFVPTEKSASAGVQSKWAKVYVAVFVETVIMLGVVTYLLYRPVPDPTTLYFMIACPYCNQRLRYRAVSHGGIGSCSRCKRMLRFPEEEDAVLEADVLQAEEDAAVAAAARAEAAAEAEEAAQQQQQQQ